MNKPCPNCTLHVGHDENGCLLATLMGVVRSREELTEAQIYELWARCDVDALWDDIGGIIDALEAGEYSGEPEGSSAAER